MLMSESCKLSYTLVTKEELYKMGCLKIKRNKEILLLISVNSFVILSFQHICSDLLTHTHPYQLVNLADLEIVLKRRYHISACIIH